MTSLMIMAYFRDDGIRPYRGTIMIQPLLMAGWGGEFQCHPYLALGLFLVTYGGIALGYCPGLRLDRTAIALLGAIAMMVCGVVPLGAAVNAIDMPTIILLYALMIISAQLRLAGFYTWVARAITRLLANPQRFLLLAMLVSAILSALLANDIVCLAFTPVLTLALLQAGFNPIPFLLGLAISSNIGSAATIIGNPQNMLIGQVGQLHFGAFLLWCGPPAAVALIGAYALLCWSYRGNWQKSAGPAGGFQATGQEWPGIEPRQVAKGLGLTAILVVLFFSSLPREMTALAAAALLLCSRKMASRSMLALVDWPLITLFCALFVVIAGLEATGLPQFSVDWLSQHGIPLRNLSILTWVSTLLSNITSNVPATMLLIRFLDPLQPAEWYTLAVSSTFAGNLITIGSIANLIVIEQARSLGVEISFRTHARIGIPVTLWSLFLLEAWIWLQQ
jgi:Na+/H+ antiporter NhaD/arsenite permease-like protein